MGGALLLGIIYQSRQGAEIVEGSLVFLFVGREERAGSQSSHWTEKIVPLRRRGGKIGEGFGREWVFGVTGIARFVNFVRPSCQAGCCKIVRYVWQRL